jgi:hypothetical protein
VPPRCSANSHICERLVRITAYRWPTRSDRPISTKRMLETLLHVTVHKKNRNIALQMCKCARPSRHFVQNVFDKSGMFPLSEAPHSPPSWSAKPCNWLAMVAMSSSRACSPSSARRQATGQSEHHSTSVNTDVRPSHGLAGKHEAHLNWNSHEVVRDTCSRNPFSQNEYLGRAIVRILSRMVKRNSEVPLREWEAPFCEQSIRNHIRPLHDPSHAVAVKLQSRHNQRKN